MSSRRDRSSQTLEVAVIPVIETLENRQLLSVALPGAVASTKLTGTIIGTPGSYNNTGNTINKAFDSGFTTYFDAQAADGDWAGLDLGGPTQITTVKFAPRSSWAGRMVGGVFEGSNTADFSSGVVNLFTISAAPVEGSFTSQTITDTGSYRYVRYLGPTGSHGNVAELEFDGVVPAPAPASSALSGTIIGTPGSYNNLGNTIVKAFDGNLSSYFDAQQSDGAWAGLDLGAPAQITQIRFAPRSSWASRMVGGIFQGSNTADFSSGVVNLFTISAAPV
ncbi:MAG TPA: hypothetical protein VLI90_20340, partial [Tepidisphaeraceae bacterium]|nr:hypothetical protein [Tepidisphaeraceae bacterium]